MVKFIFFGRLAGIDFCRLLAVDIRLHTSNLSESWQMSVI